jgi:polar amino acid transport system substrate-binding protein
MFKKGLMLLMAFCLVLSTASFVLAAEKIVNGIDANFPPFAFIDKTGKPAGFDVEALDWIAKEMGFEVEHTPIDWDGIITSLLTKKIDIIASGMSITAERAEKVNFSIPYWKIEQVMVVKKDSGLKLDDILKGKKAIGVQQGTSEAKWLKAEAEKQGWNFDLRYYSSAPLAVEDVLNGRIAAAAMDDAPARDAVSKKPVKILGTFGMDSEEFGYALRKEDTALLAKINEGLKKLMASPHWAELSKKYDLK